MDPFSDLEEKQGFVVLDGALASQIERNGIHLTTNLWSAEILLKNPDAIREIHKQYYLEGADVATSSSYQLSPQRLLERGFTKESIEESFSLSIQLCRDAREYCMKQFLRGGESKDFLIAASMGPFGAFLADGSEYTGTYGKTVSDDTMYQYHEEKAISLWKENPSFLLFETIPCYEEARVISRLMKHHPVLSGVPYMISFACRDGKSISDGKPLVDCASLFEGFGNCIAFGINCTPPQYISDLLTSLRESGMSMKLKRIAVYPNLGEVYDAVGKGWKEDTRTPIGDWGRMAVEWYELGAHIIGGCCRTSYPEIREIRSALTRHIQEKSGQEKPPCSSS